MTLNKKLNFTGSHSAQNKRRHAVEQQLQRSMVVSGGFYTHGHEVKPDSETTLPEMVLPGLFYITVYF